MHASQQGSQQRSQQRQGAIFALMAYFLWGIAPIYFKFIDQVPADEILTHRIIWSFLFMLVLLTVTQSWHQVRAVFKQRKTFFLLGVTGITIAANWLLFIWAINNHHMLEASLGYFINPLVNVFLGMLFLGERFRRMQWIAVALAFCGVAIQVWQFGSFPLIAFGLAMTFSIYGLLRKKMGVDGQTGMLIETLWLLPFALGYLFLMVDSSTSHLGDNPLSLNLWLALSGVITTIPLLFFTAAAARLRLSTLGFFQYLGPTFMFALAVWVYGETIGYDRLITFVFIWCALLLFTLDAVFTQRKSRANIQR